MRGFADMPAFAVWRHREVREGFEVVFFAAHGDGMRIEGHTSAIERGEPFAVGYVIELDEGWRTRGVQISERSRSGSQTVALESDGAGSWLVNGRPAPQLDGCYDVDLEASAMTNALPIRRIPLRAGDSAEAPAVYVRSPGLAAERLDQRYLREDTSQGHRYAYSAPAFDFHCVLTYDASGLLLDYPGIAVRVSGE